MRRVAYLAGLVVTIAALSFGIRELVVSSGIFAGEIAPARVAVAPTETPVAPPQATPAAPEVAPDSPVVVGGPEEDADHPAAAAAPTAPIAAGAPRTEPSATRTPATRTPVPADAPATSVPASTPAPVVAAAPAGAPPAPLTSAVPSGAPTDTTRVEAPPTAEPPPSPRQLVRDSAFLLVEAGRIQSAIDVLAPWVAREPADTAVILDLARLYARTRAWDASIAQYSNLLAQRRTAPLLTERGQTYLLAGDDAHGLADLLAAEALEPRAATQRQLGDFYRWRGALPVSAYWYRKAEASAPGDSAARAMLALVDRAYADRLRRPGDLEARDIGSAVQYARDNAGFSLSTARVARAFPVGLGDAVAVTAAAEQRWAARASATGGDGSLGGFGADLALAARNDGAKATASVGVLDHASLDPALRASVAADALLGRARLGVSWRRAPGYELLWAPRLLGVSCCDDGRAPVMADRVQASLSFPFLLRSELYATGEYLSLRDDARTSLALALRRPLLGAFALLWSGSYLAHDRFSFDYYSPERYVAQALGLEWARYTERVSIAARLTPGYAWVREGHASDERQRAFQLAGGLDVTVRRAEWDLVFSSGVGSGRTGGYRSGSASLFLRRSW